MGCVPTCNACVNHCLYEDARKTIKIRLVLRNRHPRSPCVERHERRDSLYYIPDATFGHYSLLGVYQSKSLLTE